MEYVKFKSIYTSTQSSIGLPQVISLENCVLVYSPYLFCCSLTYHLAYCNVMCELHFNYANNVLVALVW